MLLIRDHKAEVMEFHRVLKQGVGAYDHVSTPVPNRLQSLFPCLSLDRTCQKDRPDRESCLFHVLSKAFHVLPRQNFCRSHEGSLSAVLCAQDQGKKGQDRLSGSDISLYQAVHE